MRILFPYTGCKAIILCLLIPCLLGSCIKKNLGNYDPNALNDFSIELSIPDNYLANVDDILKIQATLSQTKEKPASAFTWQWKYYPAGNYISDPAVIVGDQSAIELPITMATGQYVLVAEATETATNIKAYKKIALTVKKLSSEGWLLLTWKNNKANISIVSSDNIVFKDFLKPSEQYPVTHKPVKLFCVNDWDAGVQPIVLKTEEPELYFIDHNTFEINSRASDAFIQTPNVKFTYFGTDMYFNEYYLWDTDGKIYSVGRNGEDDNFPTGFGEPMTGNYEAASLIMPTASSYPVTSVIYDKDGKRFMYEPYGQQTLLPFPATPPDAPFDMSNFTDEIVYTDQGGNQVTYIVSKTSDGNYYLNSLALDGIPDLYPALSRDKLPLPDGATATQFAISGKLPLLYYIADNNLYLYKMSEKHATLLYTFPSDEQVVTLRMYRETIMQTEADQPAVNNQLAIAANNSDGGIFYTFNLSPSGVLKTGQYTTKEEGFDPIVDMVYKERK